MDKIKFSLNKETLLSEQNEQFILTMVPRSQGLYYLLFPKEDIVSTDEKTFIFEYDEDVDMDVWTNRPTIEQAIEAYQNPNKDYPGLITMPVKDLYEKHYYYERVFDPAVKEKNEQEQKQRQQDQKVKKKEASKGQSSSNNQNTKQQQEVEQKSREEKTKEEPRQEQRQYYSRKQFREIRRGIRQHLNVALYRNIDLSHKQMRELRLALKAGMDITKFNSPFISDKHMRELRVGAKKGVELDLSKLDQSLYNAEQIHELRLGFQKKLNMNNYLNPAYTAEQMRELRLGQQAGFSTAFYEDVKINAEQMHIIRVDMILDNIADIIKRMLEDIREWLSEATYKIAEALKARYQGRDVMTPEQIQEARIDEAVEDIKETLIQSELIPESAYDDKVLDMKIRKQVNDLVEYAQLNPKENTQELANETAQDVCMEAGVVIEGMDDEKVVSIHQDEEVSEYDFSEAIEEALGEQQIVETEIIEEETFEAMM